MVVPVGTHAILEALPIGRCDFNGVQGQWTVEVREQIPMGTGISPESRVQLSGVNPQQKHLTGIGVEAVVCDAYLLFPGAMDESDLLQCHPTRRDVVGL